MPMLGSPVSVAEAARILGLSDEERQVEIDNLMNGVMGGSVQERASLRGLLEAFYEHPDRYQRCPSMEDARPMNPQPLPYEDC